jgi:hypothetical protein
MPKLPKTASRSRYVTSTMSGERVQAFVPAPLPPDTRTLDLGSLQGILAEANQAVGRLDGMTSASLLLRPQRGCVVLSDRGNTVLALRPAAL